MSRHGAVVVHVPLASSYLAVRMEDVALKHSLSGIKDEEWIKE